MKRILKSINERPFLAFLVACLFAVSGMAVKEHQRVSLFPSGEPVVLPSGLYIGGDRGSGGDGGILSGITEEVQNKLGSSLGLSFTADAGKFSAVTGTTCNTIAKVTVNGAKLGDPCFAGFAPNSDQGAPLGYNSAVASCAVTALDTVHAKYCVIGTPIPDGGNDGQTPVGGRLQIRVISNNQ